MRVFLLITLLFCGECLFGQCVISGRITDSSNHPVADANIVVQVKGRQDILAFTSSDNKGNFELACPDGKDTFVLKVTIIGYAMQTRTISAQQSLYNFSLTPEVTELPVVEVKREAISAKGDTVSYAVSFFANKQDRFIGDVLSRIPGIEVDASGGVKYNGKLINAYYINGLNLLENKYSIANQNIPFDIVDRVQVLQNHQPIRILDSLDETNTPALNIELKNAARNKFIGKVKAGIGLSPLQGEDEITGLKFAKEVQLIGTYKYNNTGIRLNNDLTDQVTIQRVADAKAENGPENILSVVTQPLPAIQNNRYLFNNNHLFNLSALSIAKNQAQFKYNVSYVNDINDIQGVNTTTFFFPNTDTITFREIQQSNLNINKLSGGFIYELNTKKGYVKNNFKGSAYFFNENGLINNTTNVLQRLSHPFYLLQNDFTAILPVRKKLINMTSQVTLARDDQQLDVMPGSFKEIVNDSIPYHSLTQRTMLSRLTVKNRIGFSGGTKELLLQYNAGVDLNIKGFESGIDKEYNHMVTTLNDSFSNKLYSDNFRIYASARNTLQKGIFRFDVELPVEWNIFSIRNRLTNSIMRAADIYFNPVAGVNVRLNSYYTLTAGYSLQNSRGDFLQTTTGFVLNTYRGISRKDSILPFQRINSYSAGLEYKNPLQAIFYNLSVSILDLHNNILVAPVYNDFYLQYRSIAFSNTRKSVRFSGSVNKYFLASKTNMQLYFNYMNAKALQMQNNLLSDLLTKEIQTGIKINFDKFSFASFESNSDLGYFQNRVTGASGAGSRFYFYQFRQDLKLHFFLPANTSFYINASLYKQWDDKSRRQDYFFGDAGLKKRFKKIDVQLDFRNLTNVSEYQSVLLSGTAKQVTQTRIRPRSAVLSCYFNF